MAVTLLAAAIGVALGPALAAWADRTVRETPVLAAGWWHGGESSASQIAIVSLVTGGLFGTFAYRFGESPTLAAWCWLSATCIVLAVVDVRCRRLPHRITALTTMGGALVLATAAAIENSWASLTHALLAGAAVFLMMLVVQLLAPSHTGGGDTALYGALAMHLGWFGWTSLVLGLALATGLTALAGLVVLIARKSVAASYPAGPSLVAGSLAGILLSG